MKSNKKFMGLSTLCLVLTGGMFYASCSSEDDPADFEESSYEKAEYVKNKVLLLAEEYGLGFRITDEALFKKQVLEGKICIDSVKNDFRSLAQIKGYYSSLTAEKGRIAFDTRKESLLKKKKAVEHPTDIYNGFWSETTQKHGLTLHFDVNYSYNGNIQKGLVYLNNLRLDYNTKEDDSTLRVASLDYQFVGAVPSFQYHATITVGLYYGSTYVSFNVNGEYSATAGEYSYSRKQNGTFSEAEDYNNTTEEIGGIGYVVIQ